MLYLILFESIFNMLADYITLLNYTQPIDLIMLSIIYNFFLSLT